MASSTANLGLPYPVSGDDPNVPRDVLALAGALDAYLATRARHIQLHVTTAGQTIAAATATQITDNWGIEYDVGLLSTDSGSGVDLTDGTWVVEDDGDYILTAGCTTNPTSSPDRVILAFYLNGSTLYSLDGTATTYGGATLPARRFTLSSGDAVDLRVYIGGGGTMAVAGAGGTQDTYYAAWRVA